MAVQGKPKHAQAVTPSDSLDLRHPSTHLSFADATGGLSAATIFVDTVGGEMNIGIILPPGMYPLCVTKIYDTGNSASNIVAYWDE